MNKPVSMIMLISILCFSSVWTLPTTEDANMVVPEASPASLVQRDSAAEAKAAAETDAAAADGAASIEAEWTKKETEYGEKIASLNKESRDLQRKAAEDSAADKVKLQETQATTAAKIKETNEAEAAVDQEYEITKMKEKETEAKMADDDAAAKVADKARADAFAKDLNDLKRETDEEVQEGKDTQEAYKKKAAEIAQDQMDIKLNYDTTMKNLEAEAKKDKEQLAETQKEEAAALAKDAADKNAADVSRKAAVEAEAAANLKAEADDKAKFEKDAADAAAAKAESDAAQAALHKAQADADAAEDEATRQKFEKLAADNLSAYEKAKAEADVLQAKADNAHEEYLASVQAGKDEQAAADAAMEEGLKSLNGGAMQECATDGSECLEKSGACTKIDEEKGPYLGKDLVTCTNIKPEDDDYAGESWAGIPVTAKSVEQPKPPSSKCMALKNKLKNGEWKQAMDDYDKTNPLISVACDEREIPLQDKAAAMEAVFEMANACPVWCVPGSRTSTGVTWSTNGDCIEASSVMMFKAQISVLPAWKSMKIAASVKPPSDINHGIVNICDQAKGFVAPYLASAKGEFDGTADTADGGDYSSLRSHYVKADLVKGH